MNHYFVMRKMQYLLNPIVSLTSTFFTLKFCTDTPNHCASVIITFLVCATLAIVSGILMTFVMMKAVVAKYDRIEISFNPSLVLETSEAFEDDHTSKLLELQQEISKGVKKKGEKKR